MKDETINIKDVYQLISKANKITMSLKESSSIATNSIEEYSVSNPSYWTSVSLTIQKDLWKAIDKIIQNTAEKVDSHRPLLRKAWNSWQKLKDARDTCVGLIWQSDKWGPGIPKTYDPSINPNHPMHDARTQKKARVSMKKWVEKRREEHYLGLSPKEYQNHLNGTITKGNES